MKDFWVEESVALGDLYAKAYESWEELYNMEDPVALNKRRELIQQVESLQRFYRDLGLNSDNVRTIFVLTLSYLKGKVDKLVVKSFFDVLMNHNKITDEKEMNLLLCFDELIENNHIETSEQSEFDINGFRRVA